MKTVSDFWDNIKYANIPITGVLGERERERRT